MAAASVQLWRYTVRTDGSPAAGHTLIEAAPDTNTMCL